MFLGKGVWYILVSLLLMGLARARSLSREIIDLARRIDDRYDIDSMEHDEFFKLLGFNYYFDMRNSEENAPKSNEEQNDVDSRVINIANINNKYKDNLIVASKNGKLPKTLKRKKNHDLDNSEDDSEKETYKQNVNRSNLLSQLYESDKIFVDGNGQLQKSYPKNIKLYRDYSDDKEENGQENLQEVVSGNSDAFQEKSQKKVDKKKENNYDYDNRDYDGDGNNNDDNDSNEYEYDSKRDFIEELDEDDILLPSLEDPDTDNEVKMNDIFGVIDYLETIKLKGERDERNRKLYDDLSKEDHAVMDYVPDEDFSISEYED